jgi:serine/threonine protein kinase
MPAHAATVTEYCTILARSKLVPEAEVRDLLRTWKQQGTGAEADVDAFRKHLVAKRTLTEYQAALIQRGRADGFFIGGYVILDRIGRGQSAGVYKAAHPSGQIVALKVLPASRAKDPAVLGRFQREGRLLTQLDHPNVVRAFEVGQAGNVPYIVMEHLDGETLDEVLVRRKKLPAAEAVRVIYQAMRGLEHLHEKRMVHRDLKPSNLMACPARSPGEPDTTLYATIKILDIGIGRELFDEDSPETRAEMLTTEGAILGTPDYLAPEQARDARTADIRADLYSLGCLLYHLVAGRPPFVEKTVMALMVKHATEKPPSLRAAAGDVSDGLAVAFEKLTAKKPEDRYQTPAEAAEALVPFLPADAVGASESTILPSYRAWLQSESGLTPAAEVRLPPVEAGPAKAAAVERPPMPGRATIAVADEIDVELVDLPARPKSVGDDRPLTDLSRRDFLMLGFGAGGTLIAIGAGYGAARLLRRNDAPPATPPGDPGPSDGKSG